MAFADAATNLVNACKVLMMDDATYQPVGGGDPIQTKVKISFDSASFGTGEPQVMQKHRLARFPAADIASAKRGDTFSTLTENYTVEHLNKRDRWFIELTIR